MSSSSSLSLCQPLVLALLVPHGPTSTSLPYKLSDAWLWMALSKGAGDSFHYLCYMLETSPSKPEITHKARQSPKRKFSEQPIYVRACVYVCNMYAYVFFHVSLISSCGYTKNGSNFCISHVGTLKMAQNYRSIHMICVLYIYRHTHIFVSNFLMLVL